MQRVKTNITDWVTEIGNEKLSAEDRAKLTNACVALPGLGGVGSCHLHVLASLGIGKFHLADMDQFEQVNFNRQLGATMNTIGRSKVDVAEETAKSLNKDVQVKKFPNGVSPQTIDSFLDGVDVVVDGLDFFALDARRLVYAECRKRRIPIVDAGPVGYGTALMVFLPDGPSFEEFYGITDSMSRAEILLAFAMGHMPPGSKSGEVDTQYINFHQKKFPALGLSCMMCSGAAGTEVTKLICGHGNLAAAPNGVYFDLSRRKTQPLKQKPPLKKSLRGRLFRKLAFKRFPGLQDLHDQEKVEAEIISDFPCRQPSELSIRDTAYKDSTMTTTFISPSPKTTTAKKQKSDDRKQMPGMLPICDTKMDSPKVEHRKPTLPKVAAKDAKLIRDSVLELSKLRQWVPMLALALDWVWIIGSFLLAMAVPHPAVWIGAGIIIASRQHALLVLMHEAVHYRLLNNRKWADRISDWFMTYPILVTTERFRAHHLAHHQYLNTDKDPDWVRKKDKPSWQFPTSKFKLVLLAIYDVFGGGFFRGTTAITGNQSN